MTILPAHPEGPGSAIEIDSTGAVTRAALSLEGYSLDGIPVEPWTGTLEPLGAVNGTMLYGVRDESHPWPVSLPNQASEGTWRLELTRMQSPSEFAGELSLVLFEDDGNGYHLVTAVLTFAFESIPPPIPPTCVGELLFLDDDGDGEANARDLRASALDDSFGPGVDENGLSIAEFCSVSSSACTALDFRNDEPLRLKPRDCVLARAAEGRTCRPAELFGGGGPVSPPRTCLGHALFDDADGDGEPDTTDRCPSTPSGSGSDGNGCSAEQFCSQQSLQLCRRADFENDEPLAKRPGDCARTRSKPRVCAAAAPR